MRTLKSEKFVPPLSLAADDIGQRYMTGFQRKSILSHLGIPTKEIPPSLAPQLIFLKELKKEDPEKYNAAFDLIVRKVEHKNPEQNNSPIDIKDIVAKVELKIQQSVDKMIGSIINMGETKITDVSVHGVKILDGIEKVIKMRIDEESKKFNRIEYVVKDEKTKKVKAIKDSVPEEFQKILDLAGQRVNILLVGPSGCGKTHLSGIVADSLGLDFAAQSCSAGMSESAFSGWLLPVGAGGKFEYVQSEFVRIYENGGVFLFDEIDAADSNTMLFLNAALANGEFYLPQRYQKPKVVKHKDFVCIAAANTFGNGATALYSGRNLMDGATMDRFRMGIVPMDYSATVEEKLIDPVVLMWGRMLRAIIKNRSLRKILSTRLMVEATKMKNVGWKIKEIEESYFSDWSPEEKKMVQASFEYSSFHNSLEV